MGRCEGGAAVGREAGDAAFRAHRVEAGKPASVDAAPAGGRVRTLRTREALASRPPALRPAARSSTERWAARGGDEGAAATAPDRGLEHGPRRFPEARPKGFSRRRMWSAGRRLVPIARDGETPSHGVSGGFRRPLRSAIASAPRFPALRSPGSGSAMRMATRACPGPTPRIRAMTHAMAGWCIHQHRSFPRKRESSADSQLGPRFRGDERRIDRVRGSLPRRNSQTRSLARARQRL